MSKHDTTVPIHLGLILDGNRRWARARSLPTLEGHRRGYEVFKSISRSAIKRGVQYISVYVFSTENWKRSQEEVDYLMKLLLWVTKHDVAELHKEDIRVRFLGRREDLDPKSIKTIDAAEEKTKDNTRGTIALCLNYGGHAEITDAVKKIVTEGRSAEITPALIAEHLYAPDIPPIDFIVRTSGEQRLSNFMLWRASYSELYFADCHWPDFDEAELDKALAEYADRKRRFGK